MLSMCIGYERDSNKCLQISSLTTLHVHTLLRVLEDSNLRKKMTVFPL